MSSDLTRTAVKSSQQMLALGCVTCLAAAAFAVAFFGVLTPPRDPAKLLTPPATPSPASAQPAATVLPSIPHLFLADDFKTRTHWPHVVGDAPYGYMENGYLLAPPAGAPFTHVFLSNFGDSTALDLSVLAEASPFPGSSGVSYGVFLWHTQNQKGEERFLYFGVNTNGMFTLRESVPITTTTATPSVSRWVDLVPETPSSSIKEDGKPNRLRVDAHPHRILAFINDNLVFDLGNPELNEFRESAGYDGKVGMLAFSLGKPNARVLFTRFEVYADVKE